MRWARMCSGCDCVRGLPQRVRVPTKSSSQRRFLPCIRNTARFLLGNLAGFEPAIHLVPVEDCLLLDSGRWSRVRAKLNDRVWEAYRDYDFALVVTLCRTSAPTTWARYTWTDQGSPVHDSCGQRRRRSARARCIASPTPSYSGSRPS